MSKINRYYMLDIAVHAHGNFLICSSELVLQHFQKSKSFVSYQPSLEPLDVTGCWSDSEQFH